MNLRKIAGVGLIFISIIFIEPLMGEEITNGEAAASDAANTEAVQSDEPAISGEISGGDVSGEEAASGDEPAISETPPAVEAPSIDDEVLVSEDFDGAFIFEAPPLIFENVPFAGIRSFDEIYPNLSPLQRSRVMSDFGGLRAAFEKDETPTLLPDPDAGIDLYSKVMKRNPSHVVEALILVPYMERELDFLDIYNALGMIGEIQNQEVIVNNRNINSFEETTRLSNARARRPVPDPLPAETLPYSETIYVRFVDKYIGDLYIREEISFSLYGIIFDMTNFRDVTFSLFSIMKAERFSAIIYIEPVKEGVMIYSMSGIYLPGFLVGRVNLTPNMNRHIRVLLKWIIGGLERESKRQKPRYYRLPTTPE